MSSLKAFIKQVRAAKTAADERAVVQKESAAIRASLREESSDSSYRRNNVAKLLYLFTLGERTHFGQIECLKLLASPRFADKRLGYLGTMLLLDENQEVLTLVTNSLKNDLNHANMYVVGLALCTLANISSAEMARDLCQEVVRLLSSSAYIRRKAALCAMRIIRKVPDLQDIFLVKSKQLLSDRDHGVLACGITLATDICLNDSEVIDQYKDQTMTLVKLLKQLSSSGYSPEHDVTGISDPFLQVKILGFLRVLGAGDPDVSEQMNDILAQVASNTDASKNVGNSILYETVLTILDIEADSGLRVLGISSTVKFTLIIRYVALNTLSKVITIEPTAVQRHRNTILECLRDPDISIRRRALDLSFALINESNVRVLIRELLAFLEVANNEFKPTMTTQICIAADRFAPNKRWHVDTVLRVLKLAGNYVKEQILSSFLRLIGTAPELQSYAVHKLFSAVKEDVTQEGLTLAATWIIGEFGDFLLQEGQFDEGEPANQVQPSEVVDLLETILSGNYATQAVSEYAITALMKFTARITTKSLINRIREIVSRYATSIDIEIQQRSVEYGKLFDHDSIRTGVLERMPPPEIHEDSRVLGPAIRTQAKKTRGQLRKSNAGQDLLLDLMGINDVTYSKPADSHANADLLSDIFGDSGQHNASKSSKSGDIMALFGNGNGSPRASFSPDQSRAIPSSSNYQEFTVYHKNGFKITLQPVRGDSYSPGVVDITARFRNEDPIASIDKISLQAAVPKTQKLQLQPISAPTLKGGEEANQVMRITAGLGQANIRLRLKITYFKDAIGDVSEQIDFAGFPKTLLG
ncbi:AP-1 complex subunit gamma-1 [Neolecta irregularis DAH-3]|uniref:AP-1 complex subunit gamma n=1 Tax=Neolecta irregularis (strain DAH-3) TaxID=1198029 RepID=A0A1U7LQZ6_NEOID|nr:AP-1 complex subunit gamma-1 [Neolecta irregularis DAH-3]|eukprot:OLL25064.1 AP-1 complex subunit gamma-1 [Neolecta irregularis DAH-3]